MHTPCEFGILNTGLLRFLSLLQFIYFITDTQFDEGDLHCVIFIVNDSLLLTHFRPVT